MEGGEHLAAVGRWDVGARLGAAGVTEQLYLCKLHLLEGAGGGGGNVGVWAGLLGLSDGPVVDLHWCGGDGVDLLGQGAEGDQDYFAGVMYVLSGCCTNKGDDCNYQL